MRSGDDLAAADGVVIATDHVAYDWHEVQRAARLLVETRHISPGEPTAPRVHRNHRRFSAHAHVRTWACALN